MSQNVAMEGEDQFRTKLLQDREQVYVREHRCETKQNDAGWGTGLGRLQWML